MQSSHFPFRVFTAAVLVVLVVPTLIMDGMFMDGLLYTCVAKNLSEGLGTFWKPHYSATYLSFFDQQPPLGFAIQSIAFKIFGTSIYTARIYSFLTLCAGAFLITKIWSILFKNEEGVRKTSWLPVLLWIIIPVCSWAYSNNMLECTMVVFDLLAVLFLIKFTEKNFLPHLLLAGIFIFLASLTKGFQGLFPLAALFFHWIAYRKHPFLKMVLNSAMLVAVPALIYLLVFQIGEAREGLSTYLNRRVWNSIASVATVESRFYLAGRLFTELLAPALLSGLAVILLKRKTGPEKKYPAHFIFFLLIGLSASLPLMITLEQRGFYLATSFPFFAIAIAALAAPYISGAIEKINTEGRSSRIFNILSVVLLCGAVLFSAFQIGKAKRNKTMLHDIYLIGEEIPKGSIASATPALWHDWEFQEYFVRHFYISLDGNAVPSREFLISEAQPEDTLYKRINIPTEKYNLYKAAK